MSGGRDGKKYRWDASMVRTSYADAVNVSMTRDEVALLFGVSPARQPGRRELIGRVCKCVILNPFSAKRMMRMLRDYIAEYEARYGALAPKSPSGAGLSLEPSAEAPPLWEGAGREARDLVVLVRGLGAGFGFERSFKMSRESLLDRRFLMTLAAGGLGEDGRDRVVEVGRSMGMPEEFAAIYREHLPRARYFHFGFEEEPSSCLYKAYLEFWTDWEKEIYSRPERSEPFLLYLGFKWDASDPRRRVLTRYTCHPNLAPDAILGRISPICGPGEGGAVNIARSFLHMAPARVGRERILYMEVTEEDNPRISFDLNVYQAGIPLKACAPVLLEACRHYRIDEERFRGLLESVRGKKLGHLSGGIDRNGGSFATIYFGVEGHGR